MRQPFWGLNITFNGRQLSTPDVQSSYGRSSRTAGLIREAKGAAWSCQCRDMRHQWMRVRRAAANERCRELDVQEVLQYVVARTKRLTLYDSSIDADALLNNAASDPELDQHIKLVVQLYKCINNDFTRSFFQSYSGATLARHAGYVEHNGDLYAEDGLSRCAHCDEYMFDDQSVENVYTDSSAEDYETVHLDCIESCGAVFCEVSRLWFDENCEFVRLSDSDEYACLEYCINHDLIELEEHDEDEDEDDDDDEYRDEDREPTYVRAGVQRRPSGYHVVPRPWNNMQSGQIPTGSIGVELELGFKNGDKGRSDFLKYNSDERGRSKQGLPFLFERDGSLSSIPGGLEVVSDPLPLHAGYQVREAPWRQMLSILYKAGAQGWKWRTQAGIHVNICVTDESETTIFKFASFIGAAASMSKLIAGRKQIYGTKNGYYTVSPQRLRTPQPSEFQHIFEHGKYSAVHRRNRDCLEVRIFGSNIRYEGFMACVEYCVAVMEFVRPLHVLDVYSPTAAAEFRNWLGSVHGRFPNLCARLGVVPHTKGTAVPSNVRITPMVLAA